MIDMALIEQCKNPNVESVVIQRIIKVESNAQPFAINVNKVGSFVLKSKQEATKIAKGFIKLGYSLDLGLMQFNSKNLKKEIYSHFSVEDMFDECKNIRAGSDLFYRAYKSTNKSLSHKERIDKALSIYNTGNVRHGFKNGYVAKFKAKKALDLAIAAKRSGTRVKLNYSSVKFK